MHFFRLHIARDTFNPPTFDSIVYTSSFTREIRTKTTSVEVLNLNNIRLTDIPVRRYNTNTKDGPGSE